MDNINELMELSYTFFPKGVPECDKTYCATKEHLALIEKLKLKDLTNRKFKKFCKELLSSSSAVRCLNYSSEIGFDRCSKAGFIGYPGNWDWLVCVSILAPLFVTYEHDYRSREPFIQLKDSSSGFLYFKEEVQKLMRIHFPSYNELSEELSSYEVPNIQFDFNGYVEGGSISLEYSTPMTFFNVFFSASYP